METYYVALMIKKNPEDPWLVSQVKIEPKDYTAILSDILRQIEPMLVSMRDADTEGRVFKVRG